MNKLKELEKKLINNNEQVYTMNLLIDSVFIYKRYESTFGNFEKVNQWQEIDRHNYMRRYNLSEQESNHNIDLIRQYNTKK